MPTALPLKHSHRRRTLSPKLEVLNELQDPPKSSNGQNVGQDPPKSSNGQNVAVDNDNDEEVKPQTRLNK